MMRQRRSSTASTNPSDPAQEQELGGMYDYLAKIILLGPSGCGKSCLLHRFIKNEWRTERFRSVARSYYRGAAGAVLVYDVSSLASFNALPTFLADARALGSPRLAVLLAGNKADLADEYNEAEQQQHHQYAPAPSAATSTPPLSSSLASSLASSYSPAPGSNGLPATLALHGREVPPDLATSWSASACTPVAVAVEVSSLSGTNVAELFDRLARIILAKIELGEVDPGDPASGIQYGAPQE
ncbi:hypothetical protein B0A49_07932 [Cryomyces minteri]|uniref:GTP-binding protein ypt4 n=1 Tax=Cryomyces minteri TaxID=331657 RepID=A0A4U0WLZ8_9PEZI|nr:hypothetical protein B0A49_07932 [Cryomyces minteri]